MRTNKEDFELQIIPNDIPEDLRLGIASISIFKGNIALRFAASDNGGHDPIISKFSIELLDESRKALEKKLVNANFDSKSAQKLIAFIIEKRERTIINKAASIPVPR